MNTPRLSPEQYADTRREALHAAARLRAQAIDDLLSGIAQALRRGWHALLQRCRLPHPEF